MLPLFEQDARNARPDRPPLWHSFIALLIGSLVGWIACTAIWFAVVAPALDLLVPIARVLPR